MAFLTPLSSTAFTRAAPLRPTVCRGRVLRNAQASRTRRARLYSPRASIEQEVSAEIKAAMRSKDAAALTALRSIRAAFLTALKADGAGDTLSDAEAVAVLRKLAKMRAESIAMFRTGGRDDLAEAEAAELTIIERWLPTLADEDVVRGWVADAVAKTGASKPSDMGKVMGVIMKEHREEVDGNVVRGIVAEALKS